MKFWTTFTKRVVPLFILFFVLCNNGFAQSAEKKLSFNVGMGIPVTFFTIKSNLVGIYTGSARYSFNKTWSLEGRLTSNIFYAKTTNPPKSTLDGSASDVLSYRTAMYGLHGMVYYNLHNIFNLNRRPESNWLPYLNAGIGYHIYKPSANFVNGNGFKLTKFGKPCRDYQVGFGTRYFINSVIDLTGGVEYHFVESYYLDATGGDKKLDNFLNIYAGVSIKLGAKPWDNLVDWSHKNIENPKESPKNYAKWAGDVTVGIPFMFTPVGHSLTGMFGLDARYSFSKSLGLAAFYNYGHLSGTNDVVALPAGTGPRYTVASNVKEFSTAISQVGLKVYFNLRNLTSEPSARQLFNHYAIVGGGFIFGKQNATFADGRSYSDIKVNLKGGVQSIVVGYEARRYLNSKFDAIGGVDFSFNQSKYFDAAPAKSSLNSNLYFHTGITFKIGTSGDIEHIDWSYSSYNNYKDKTIQIEQVPVIEKPVTDAPKIDTSMAVAPPLPPPVEPPAPTTPIEPTPVTPTPPPVVVPEPVPTTPVPPAPAPVPPAPAVTPTRPPAPAPAQTPVARQRNRPRPATPAPTPAAPDVPSTYQASDEVTPPPMMYNVVVACYSVNKLAVAEAFKTKLKADGFSPSIYRSSSNSRLLRMSVISTDNRAEALNVLRRARKEVEPQSWIYIYNKQ